MFPQRQSQTLGNGIFGIADAGKTVPLQARMQPHALVYFEDPYFVCRVRAGGPDEQWCSILTLQNTFGFGAYHWRAKAWNPGPYKHHWLGGFERHHGFWQDGILGFYLVDGIYKTWTAWDGKLEEKVLTDQDWSTEKGFKVVWSPSQAVFYVEDVLVATHTTNVPQGPMNFFFEAGRISGTTESDHAVFFREASLSG